MSVPILDRRQMARWTTLLLVFGVLALLSLSGARRAQAGFGFINVDPGADGGIAADGACSIQEAIDLANASFLAVPGLLASSGYSDCNGNIIGTLSDLRDGVNVPAGTYDITASINLIRETRLRGANAGLAAFDPEDTATPLRGDTLFAVSETILNFMPMGSPVNKELINIGSSSEVDGFTLTGITGLNNSHAIRFQANRINVEIRNNIITGFDYGISLRGGASTIGVTDNEIIGNVFVNMSNGTTNPLTGIGIVVLGENPSGSFIIENNWFQALSNYAIRQNNLFNTSVMANNLEITDNYFLDVPSAARLYGNNNLNFTGNYLSDINGLAGTYGGAVAILGNSPSVSILGNTFIDRTLPAVFVDAPSGFPNNLSGPFGFARNRLYGIAGGNSVGLNVTSNGVMAGFNADENWWGSNDGPGVGSNDFVTDPDGDVTLTNHLQFDVVVGEPNLVVGATAPVTNAYADFYRSGFPVDDLNGQNALLSSTPITFSTTGLLNQLSPASSTLTLELGDSTVDVFYEAVATGAETISATLDAQTSTAAVNITTGPGVVCDWDNGTLTEDVGAHVTEGAQIGDRCIVRLTEAPDASGPGDYVEVIFDVDLLNSGVLDFRNPPNVPFIGYNVVTGAGTDAVTIRFGATEIPYGTIASPDPNARLAWNDPLGYGLNMQAFDDLFAGPVFYSDLIFCNINVEGAITNYVDGPCPGLESIPVTVYDPGVIITTTHSDYDSDFPVVPPPAGATTTDICTINFSRQYFVELSGPPAVRIGVSLPATSETVTVTSDESADTANILDVSGGPLTFDRSDWNVPQPLTLTRVNIPVNLNIANNVSIFHDITSDSLGAPNGTESPYRLWDNAGELFVLQTHCPLLEGRPVPAYTAPGAPNEVPMIAPAEAAPEQNPAAVEGEIGE